MKIKDMIEKAKARVSSADYPYGIERTTGQVLENDLIWNGQVFETPSDADIGQEASEYLYVLRKMTDKEITEDILRLENAPAKYLFAGQLMAKFLGMLGYENIAKAFEKINH